MIFLFFIFSSLLFSALLFSSLLFSSLLSSLLFSFLRFSSLLSSFSPLFFSPLFSSLSSLFSLCLLSPLSPSQSFSVSVSVCWWCVCRRVCLCGVVWCGVVCVVWCGTLTTPCVDSKTLSVCRFKTSPCMPALRAHAFQHVSVLPAYTGTF